MTPDQLTPEQRYLYEERWAIKCFDGHQPEHVAKAAALAEIIGQQQALFFGPNS